MNKVKNLSPCLVQFKTIGSSDLGYITAVQHPDGLPFTVKRVYWTYFIPHNVERGNHAHYNLHQIIVAVSGIYCGNKGDTNEFILDNPIQDFIFRRCIDEPNIQTYNLDPAEI